MASASAATDKPLFSLLKANKWTDRFQVLSEDHSKEKVQVRLRIQEPHLVSSPVPVSPAEDGIQGLKHA